MSIALSAAATKHEQQRQALAAERSAATQAQRRREQAADPRHNMGGQGSTITEDREVASEALRARTAGALSATALVPNSVTLAAPAVGTGRPHACQRTARPPTPAARPLGVVGRRAGGGPASKTGPVSIGLCLRVSKLQSQPSA